MNPNNPALKPKRIVFVSLLVVLVAGPIRLMATTTVDFRFASPEWQTAICLPDDPHKSLVDHDGQLLYHYRQGGREFGTRIAVEVVEGAVWQGQELVSPRVLIVQTRREADGLQIVEETFAVTDLLSVGTKIVVHRRGWWGDAGWQTLELDPTRRHELCLPLPPL